MAKTFHYRFEAYLYKDSASRVELERGETDDWVYIRRRHQKLADERKIEVMLYVYNDFLRYWEYISKVIPGGKRYDAQGDGPYYLADDGRRYYKKGDRV